MASTTPRVIHTSDPTRIAIEWSDGAETRYTPRQLRGLCPCAECVDELSGVRRHDPNSVSDELTQGDARLVGNYALSLRFSDGHATGIYTFNMLRECDPEA
jgi:DUF971 family protein